MDDVGRSIPARGSDISSSAVDIDPCRGLSDPRPAPTATGWTSTHEAETLDNRPAERAERGVVGVAQRPEHACRRTRNARRLKMRRTNEGRVVDAAVKLLEAFHGQAADPGGENPDRNGTRSGVDWCMQIKSARYWMEHTLVQPFPSERQGSETVDKVAHHLEMQGTNLGGPGCYEMTLAADAQIANGPKGDRQLETLDQWMKETAARCSEIPSFYHVSQ